MKSREMKLKGIEMEVEEMKIYLNKYNYKAIFYV